MIPEHQPAPRKQHGPWALVTGVIGMVLYVIVGWLYLGSGLVMPSPWFYLMWVVWLAGLWVIARVFKRSPAWTLAVPAGAAAFWFLVLMLGDALLGWTA